MKIYENAIKFLIKLKVKRGIRRGSSARKGSNKLNGFNEADYALKTGLKLSQSGLDYMGATHYSSNLLTANHVYAGVNGVYTLAILRGTYGRLFVADGESAGFSGKQINSRVDFNVKAWAITKPVIFDCNVA